MTVSIRFLYGSLPFPVPFSLQDGKKSINKTAQRYVYVLSKHTAKIPKRFFTIAGILTLLYTVIEFIETFSSISSNLIATGKAPSFLNIALHTFTMQVNTNIRTTMIDKKQSVAINATDCFFIFQEYAFSQYKHSNTLLFPLPLLLSL